METNNLSSITRISVLKMLFVALGGLLLLCNCEDFFEKDLAGKEVVIVAPSDLLTTQYTTQNFWWEKLDGALTYNLQIATPSFDNLEKVLVDTNVSINKFTFSLYPGKFQWRIRPANGSSNGQYIVRSLEIDTTLDLRGQEVVLKSPQAEYASNKNSLKFTWDKLFSAADYRFEVRYQEWSGSKVISPVLTQHDTITVGGLQEGTYYWGVQAQNNGSATAFSTRKVIIDKTSPKIPSLSAPLDSATIPTWPVTLKWSRATDSGSSITDSVVVATDKSFKTNSIKISERGDGLTKIINLKENGKYYWKVISQDAAGNYSPESEINLLIIGSTGL